MTATHRSCGGRGDDVNGRCCVCAPHMIVHVLNVHMWCGVYSCERAAQRAVAFITVHRSIIIIQSAVVGVVQKV